MKALSADDAFGGSVVVDKVACGRSVVVEKIESGGC